VSSEQEKIACLEQFKVQSSRFKVIGRPVAAAIRLKPVTAKPVGETLALPDFAVGRQPRNIR
jgi:hypothetical protein